jgi:hypothetical protein
VQRLGGFPVDGYHGRHCTGYFLHASWPSQLVIAILSQVDIAPDHSHTQH